jgi:hypothetical protein
MSLVSNNFSNSGPGAPTVADVKADPEYWVAGPGYEAASCTLCPHRYNLTDSCPGCDRDEETPPAAS